MSDANEEKYRVLVCGGRDYADTPTMYRVLDDLLSEHGSLVVIEGGARGADALAEAWTRNNNAPHNVGHLQFPADWKKHGKGAGPIRNHQMLTEGKPDMVLAFPGGRGTAHMVGIARAAGIATVEVE